MNRREFTFLGAGCCLSQLFPLGIFATDDQTTISGDFFLLQKNGQYGVRAENLTIDGLSFPKFSWQWIGMGLAQGVLSFIGGTLFAALADAIFNGTSPHVSIEALLQDQLEKFAQIVQETVTQNEVRRYWADTGAYFKIYQEYTGTPSKETLEFLKDHSAVALSNLESLGFAGYRTYMSAAGLRLMILQDAVKQRMATLKDYERQSSDSIGHHNAMIAYIDQQTEPSTFAPKGSAFTNYFQQDPVGRGKWYFNAVRIHTKILGVQIDEGYIPMYVDHTPYNIEDITHLKPMVIPDNRYLADRITDFGYLRTKTKAENTDLGQKLVSKWTTALAKMKQKYSV